MDIKDIVDDTIQQIDAIVEEQYPIVMSELGATVFDTMGRSPTDRGWSFNSPNTKKKEGIYGERHRNVDTGELRDMVSSNGFLANDNWFSQLPEKYRDANALGAFDDIGETDGDSQFIVDRLTDAIVEGLK